MERAYRNVSYSFVGILLVALLGFWKSHFGLYPGFGEWPVVVHFHALVLLLWLGMLIVQPVLIRTRQFAAHRWLGRVSFGLVPLVVLSMLAVSRNQFVRFVGLVPERQNLADLFIPLSQTLLFGYGLAMVYRRQPGAHMRYVVASSFVFLSPALGRVPALWNGVPFSWTSVLISFLVPDIVLLWLLLLDGRNRKNIRPYLVSLALLLASHIGWLFLPGSSVWQLTASELVRLF